MPFLQLAFADQNVDPELQITIHRLTARTHAIAAEELGDLWVFAALGEGLGKERLGFLRMFAGIVERTLRLLDKDLRGLRVVRDEVSAQDDEAAGDVAQNVGVIEDGP